MTFFVDPDLETEIMKNIVKDVKALATNEPNITENKVNHPSFIRSLFQYFFFQDWRDFQYVVIPNLAVFPSQSDAEFADTVASLFRY